MLAGAAVLASEHRAVLAGDHSDRAIGGQAWRAMTSWSDLSARVRPRGATRVGPRRHRLR
jgi:hypothetical protein